MIERGETTGLARASLAEQAFGWFQRVLALYCLVAGILYWARLVGVYPDAQWRFDLIPPHWQAASVTLATLYPFAALGLWMLASWGLVIWLMCALTEAAMHGGLPHLFGERWPVLAVHGCAALAFAALRLLLFKQKRAGEVSAH